MRLRHDDTRAPSATAFVADALPGAETHGHWCQLAVYWAEHASLPCFVGDGPSGNASVPGRAGNGSLYVLWSAQIIGQVDIDTIAAFKQAAGGFRSVVAPDPGDHAARAPLYGRYLLIRRSDGGLISGNAARAIVGWDPLPPPPAGAQLSAAAERDREIAHDDAQWLSRRPPETHVSLAERLPDYFVCVRVASRYFSLRFGAVVIAVGVRAAGAAAAAISSVAPAAAPAVLLQRSQAAAPPVGFLAYEEDAGITLVTVAVRAATAAGQGWVVEEEAPEAAQSLLAEAGFFCGEGTNAASIELPLAEVAAMLASWGWTQLVPEELAMAIAS